MLTFHFVFFQWAGVNRRADTARNPNSLCEIIGEIVQEIIGQTNLPRVSEIKSARVPGEVRSRADHPVGRANPTPPFPVGAAELYFPVGVKSVFFVIAYEPYVMQEYAEGDLPDPGLRFLAPIRVISDAFRSDAFRAGHRRWY